MHRQRSYSSFTICTFVGLALMWLVAPAVAEEMVAKVNGKPISAEQVHLQFFLKQIPDAAAASQREQLISNLVDRELIRQFLTRRRIKVDRLMLEHQQTLVRKVIEKGGGSLEEVFENLNLTEEVLTDFLSLNLMWDSYAKQEISDETIIHFFEEHRTELDGTRVSAAHIVRVIDSSADAMEWSAAEKLLADVRAQIVAGTITFADAAVQYSQSPTKAQGGSLGKFEFSGRVPKSVAQAAFQLKPGELSEPIRSPFGVHLIQVEAIIPGQLSAEDARPQIIKILSQQMWDQTVSKLRSAARIELLEEVP